MVKVTMGEFMRYEDVRRSGMTNMFHVTNVMNLSGLSKEKIKYIMSNYQKFIDKLSPAEKMERQLGG